MVPMTHWDRSEHTCQSCDRLYCHHQSVSHQMSLNLLIFEGEIAWAPSLAVAPLGPVPQRRHHKDDLRERSRNVELTIITTTAGLEGSVVMPSLTLDSQLECSKKRTQRPK